MRLVLDNPANASLTRALTAGMSGPLAGKAKLTRIYARVTALGAGTITLDRPLPMGVQLEWGPQLQWGVIKDKVVGVESLTIRFPYTAYGGQGACCCNLGGPWRAEERDECVAAFE